MLNYSKFISLIALLLGVWVMLATVPGTQAQLLKKSFAQADLKAPEVVPPVAPPVDAPPKAVVPGTAEEGQPLVIKIAATAGLVQVRAGADQPWQVAKAGMDLSIGSEIRTGLRSVCKFTIDGNHEITLDRLGVVMVLDAIKSDGKIKTDVGMKYGRTQYKVETGAAEHDAKVHAPSATLAVRGSFVTLEDNDAFGSRAVVDHSERAIYKTRAPEGQVRVVTIELIKGTIEPNPDNGLPKPPANVAYDATINDIGARLAKANERERELVGLYPIYNGAGHGGGGLPPPGEIQDQLKDTFKDKVVSDGILSGSLDIFASWSGIDPIVVFAIDPLDGRLSTQTNLPAGFQTSVRSGGPAPGIASGSTSSAQLFYPSGVPSGSWGVGISVAGPPSGSTDYTIDIFIHPQGSSEPQLLNSFQGTLDAGNPSNSHNFGVTGGGSEGQLGG